MDTNENIANIANMMKTLQTKIKNGTLNYDELQHDDNEQVGGGPYNYMKKYLDMVFSTETQLKKDQQDSLERLTKIKEAESKKEDESNKQKQFEEENLLLAQNEKNIQDAKENAQKIREQANIVDQEKNEALQKSINAKKQVDEAEQQVSETESYNKTLEDVIKIRKQHVQKSETIMQEIFKSLGNKELVSLEETQKSIEENAAIQDIQKKVLDNLEKKTDDLLI